MSNHYPSAENDMAGCFVETFGRRIQRRHKVVVVTPRLVGDPPKEVRGGVEIHRFPVWIRQPDFKYVHNRIVFLIYFFSALLACIRLCAKHRFSLVHAHFALPSGLIGLVVSGLYGLPLITTAYGSDLHVVPFKSKFKVSTYFIKQVLRHSRCVIGSSTYISNIALSMGAERAKTVLTGLETDYKIFGSAKSNRKVLLFVGRLSPEKGVKYLLYAMPQLQKQLKNLKLLIIGTGQEEDELKQLAAEKKANCIFLGFIPHKYIMSFIKLSDVCVLPSLAEGLSVFIQESMWLGKPIIASNVGGIPDIIVNEETGVLLFEPGNVEELTDKITRVFKEERLARRLGVNARRFAQKHLDPEKTYKEILGVYQEALT